MNVTRDILGFLWRRRAFWLAPLLLAIVVISALAIASEATLLAPFIYPLF